MCTDEAVERSAGSPRVRPRGMRTRLLRGHRSRADLAAQRARRTASSTGINPVNLGAGRRRAVLRRRGARRLRWLRDLLADGRRADGSRHPAAVRRQRPTYGDARRDARHMTEPDESEPDRRARDLRGPRRGQRPLLGAPCASISSDPRVGARARRDRLQERRLRRRHDRAQRHVRRPPTRRPTAAKCGPFTSSGRSVRADVPADRVRAGRRRRTADPATGVTTCIGTGGWRLHGADRVPAPGVRQADDLRPDLRLRGQHAVRRARRDRRGVPGTPTTTGRARSSISRYDAIEFARTRRRRRRSDRQGRTIDDCGRYRVDDITPAVEPVHRPRLRRRGRGEHGPDRRDERDRRRATRRARCDATPDFEAFVAEDVDDRHVGRERRAAVRDGIYVAIFRAHKCDRDGELHRRPVRDAERRARSRSSGATVPTNDYYFKATQTTRPHDGRSGARPRPARTAPACSRARSVADSLVYSGTGGISDTTNCQWENHAAASLPGHRVLPGLPSREQRRCRRAPHVKSSRSSSARCAPHRRRPRRRSDERRRRGAVPPVVRHQRHLRRRGRAADAEARPLVQVPRSATRKSPLDLGRLGRASATRQGLDPRLPRHARHGVRHVAHRSRRDRLRRRRLSHGDRRRLRRARPLRARAASIATPSTGLISLRPLSNIDPSASPATNASSATASPARSTCAPASSSRSSSDPQIAVTAIGSVFLPFGDDDMLLGDATSCTSRSSRSSGAPIASTRRASSRTSRRASASARCSRATTRTTQMRRRRREGVPRRRLARRSPASARSYELTPRASLAVEAQGFIPLPDAFELRHVPARTRRAVHDAQATDYAPARSTAISPRSSTLGLMLRVSADVTADVMVGTGQGGARGDDFRVTTGLVWAPQPAGAAAPGRNDRDGDGIPDAVDACPDEPEDKDGFQDEDGCPDPDNDGDGIPDAKDKCPNEPEDKDGFQDEDGCPDRDNDNDGIPDAPTSARTSPRTRTASRTTTAAPIRTTTATASPTRTTSARTIPRPSTASRTTTAAPTCARRPVPRSAPIASTSRAQPVAFDRDRQADAGGEAAADRRSRTIIKHAQADDPRRGPRAARHEVHERRARSRRRRSRTRRRAGKRAHGDPRLPVAQGVPPAQIQAVGIGSDRPLGTAAPDRSDQRTRRPHQGAAGEDAVKPRLLFGLAALAGVARRRRTRSASTTSRSRRRHSIRATSTRRRRSDEALDLANIVQSAAKGVTTVQEAPAIVTVITGRRDQERQFQTLDELVDTVPGWYRSSASTTRTSEHAARARPGPSRPVPARRPVAVRSVHVNLPGDQPRRSRWRLSSASR